MMVKMKDILMIDVSNGLMKFVVFFLAFVHTLTVYALDELQVEKYIDR